MCAHTNGNQCKQLPIATATWPGSTVGIYDIDLLLFFQDGTDIVPHNIFHFTQPDWKDMQLAR